jgi:hypothetical protein
MVTLILRAGPWEAAGGFVQGGDKAFILTGNSAPCRALLPPVGTPGQLKGC